MNATVRNALLALAGFATLGVAGSAATLGDEKAATEVKLIPVNYKGFLEQVASHKDAKLVVVDIWATWCGPCMENFPHLVEMHHKYADQGMVAMSLSMDDADAPKKVAAATKFLKDKKATFTNMIMQERMDDFFDKLNIGVIPAVFVYGPDGKEIKRFTLEDVDKPFTYEQVETFVKDYLAGKVKK